MQEKARHFNSIKVQLERNKLEFDGITSNIFQFHKGTIRTISDVEIDIISLISIP